MLGTGILSQEMAHRISKQEAACRLALAKHDAQVFKRAKEEFLMGKEYAGMGQVQQKPVSQGLCGSGAGRQTAARVLWDQAKRYERKAEALKMLGNLIADNPTRGGEDSIEPLLWELLVRADWR